MTRLRDFLEVSLKRLNVDVTRFSTERKSRANAVALQYLELLKILPSGHVRRLVSCLHDSKSQYRQRLFFTLAIVRLYELLSRK